MSGKTEIFFASTAEFCDAVASGKAGNQNSGAWNQFANGFHGANWFGVDAEKEGAETVYKTTQRLIENGWTRGAELMAQVEGVDAPRATDIRRRMIWTDNGDEIEMQRVYSGNLDTAWRRTRRVNVSGPVRVRIAVDALAHAIVDSAEMRWRGVAAMRLADALTEAGYMVEIESAFHGGSFTKLGNVTLRVVVKPYDQPINLPVLAATTALPAFFRMHGHLMHLVAAASRGIALASVGYSVKPLEKAHIPADKAERLFIAPQTIRNAYDANQWLITCMEEIEKGIDDGKR